MIPQNASRDLIEHEMEQINKRLEYYNVMRDDHLLQIAKLDRWIACEEGDLEIAQEMLAETEPTEGVDEEGQETFK